MKKLTLFILILFLSVSFLFASSEIYTRDSAQYRTLRSLALMAGKELPNMTFPVSGSQMLSMLKSLDYKFEGRQKEIYDELFNSLSCPDKMISYDSGLGLYGFAGINVEENMHTSSDTGLVDWIREYKDINPFLNIGGKFWFGDYFFSEMDIYVKAKVSAFINKAKVPGIKSNLAMPSSAQISQIPVKANASLGNENFSLIIGRDHVSAGNGITGNLSLGDNFCFEDFVKFSVLMKPLSYDMTVLSFDMIDDKKDNPLKYGIFDMDSPNNIVFVHRMSAALGNFGFTIFEGMLQYGSNIFANTEVLNPFMIYHNTLGYENHNQNNFFGLEVGFTPIKGLNITGQGMIDQLKLSSESYADDDYIQNAFGALLNINGAFEFNCKPATWYVEGAYTSPALYLKENYGSYSHDKTDLIVGNVFYCDDQSDVSYLGYKYGPDSIVGAFGFSFSPAQDLNLSFDSHLIVHGENGIEFYENQNSLAETGLVAFKSVTPTGVPEYRITAVVSASWSLWDYLVLEGQVGLLDVINYHNIKDYPNVFDVQASLTGSLKIDKLVMRIIENNAEN